MDAPIQHPEGANDGTDYYLAIKWQAKFKGKTSAVTEPNVVINKKGKTAQAQHGSFDNNVEVIERTLRLIAGAPIAKPVEWLDY